MLPVTGPAKNLTLVALCAHPEVWYEHDAETNMTLWRGFGLSLILDVVRMSGEPPPMVI